MEENASDTSENYLQIVTKKDRVIIFCKLYWRMIIIISTALAFLPIAYIGNNNAYAVFYIFLLCSTYWAFDVLHPGLVGLLPIVLTTLLEFTHQEFISEVHIHNHTLNTLGVMMMISAIEHSKVHRRIALKLLLIFGCSHYRLSLLLFFTTMFLAMWVTNTMACGLMIPIVKAILVELERMGILEVHHNITKGRKQTHVRHELSNPRPTVFSIFYFLGIAYSSSIGGLGTLMGSESNETYIYYSQSLFPYAPYIDFPHYMLLNLPGVLLMEALLYLWMNFYFMGLFRAQSEIALEIGLSEEESQYIQTLLSTQYLQLGKINFHEGIVGSLVILAVLLHIFRTALYRNCILPRLHTTTYSFLSSTWSLWMALCMNLDDYVFLHLNPSLGSRDLKTLKDTLNRSPCDHLAVASPIMACAFLFFLVPVKLDFLKFFKRRSDTTHDLYPTAPSKACLNWSMMRDEIHWTVLFISAGGCTIFEALRTSGITDDIDEWFLYLKNWPKPAQSLMVILICKVITEFGDNSCVLGTLLPSIAKLSVESKGNPHSLMTAAHLTCALPFHLIIGTPANAMIAEYMRIHPWKMMKAGFGPSLIAICVSWFTVTLWAKTIWPDINQYPLWADNNNILFYKATRSFT